jgi:acetyl-CoA carboxylase biotin carboxyl carrier protein
VDLKDIKAIIDLMKKNSVSEFELEKQDFKIRLKRGMGGGVVSGEEGVPQLINYAPAASGLRWLQPVRPRQSHQPPPPPPTDADIKSPMIGTFIGHPSPDSAAYVEIGTEVNPGHRGLHYRSHEGHERDQS